MRPITRFPIHRPLTYPRRFYSPTTRPPPGPKIEPTIFDSKSQPREVHYRPENHRGMPTSRPGTQAPWEQLRRVNTGKVKEGELEEAFDGPSRPRMYYDRPGERELPKISVS